jgi:hypothetical protein
MTVLLHLALFPLLVRNLRHHLHVFFGLFLVLIFLLLVVSCNLLLDELFALLNQTDFKPFLEHLIRLFLFYLFLEPFFLLFPELLFPLKSILHELLLFPLVHTSCTLLVLFVLLCLLFNKFLV